MLIESYFYYMSHYLNTPIHMAADLGIFQSSSIITFWLGWPLSWFPLILVTHRTEMMVFIITFGGLCIYCKWNGLLHGISNLLSLGLRKKWIKK